MDNSNCLKRELITCKRKSCGRKFTYILKHLSQSPECEKTYSKEERQMLQVESMSITRDNQLSQKRSKYDPEKYAKKYQIKKLDEKWMEQKRLEKRTKYDPVARSERHKKKQQEELEQSVKELKQSTHRQNESYKEDKTESLQRQVKNLKDSKLSRGMRAEIRKIRHKIEEIYQSIERQIESTSAIAETQQSYVTVSKLFNSIKASETWLENSKDLEMLK